MTTDIHTLATELEADNVAQWQFKEWGSGYAGSTLESFTRDIRQSIGHESIPLILVASVDGVPVGTASIIFDDLPARKDLNPWIASIYVKPEFRRRGLAEMLIKAAIAKAQAIGLERLYLFTHDLASYYERFGWSVVDRSTFDGHSVDILIRAIDK